jgi:hypothetical protein|tara:strand:- start:462 stop:860 length:399 start_codon:yes stop_codon:yes gene_type:complete
MTEEKVSVEKLTRVYIKIRDKRAEISVAFKQEDDDLKAKQEQVKRALLDYCKENEVESFRTAAGLCYRSVKKRFWTSDWESMHKFVLEHQVPEFLTKSLNQTNVQQFLEDNPDLLPPGLNVDSEYVISVRKK